MNVSSLILGVILGASLLTVQALVLQPPTCAPGPIVAALNDTFTPLLLLNSPFGTNYSESSNGSLPIDNGTRTLTLGGAYNGNVWGYFERIDWTVAVGESKGGSERSCAAMFYLSAKDLWTGDGLPVYNGTLSNFSNDSEVPTHAGGNLSDGEVVFNDRFTSTTNLVDTCGHGTQFENATSTHITVGIGFEYQGSWHVVNTVLAIVTHYQYTFPADGGRWSVDNLSSPGGPGGGWAFSYSPCS